MSIWEKKTLVRAITIHKENWEYFSETMKLQFGKNSIQSLLCLNYLRKINAWSLQFSFRISVVLAKICYSCIHKNTFVFGDTLHRSACNKTHRLSQSPSLGIFYSALCQSLNAPSIAPNPPFPSKRHIYCWSLPPKSLRIECCEEKMA